MNDRDWYDAASEALARAGRKPPRRRKMKVTKLPDDPRIAASKKKGRAPMPLASKSRGIVRGDRIGESEDAVWLNVGRMIEDAPGKISGKDIA